VNECEVQIGKQNIVLKKSPDKDEWILARELLPVDSGEWNKTFNAVIDLKAESFASDSAKDTAKFGLSNPVTSVILKKKDGTAKEEIRFGKVKDKAYAKRMGKDTIYQVNKDILEKVTRPAGEYQSKKLADFNRFEVKKIQIEKGKSSIEFSKQGPDWKLTSEPTLKIDNAKVDEYLTHLQDTKITKYLPGTTPAKSSDLVLRLFDNKNGKETEVVKLSFEKPKSKVALGVREGVQWPFLLAEPEWKKLNAEKEEFVAAEKKEDPSSGIKQDKSDIKKDDEKTAGETKS
jgi:hypothetical protein